MSAQTNSPAAAAAPITSALASRSTLLADWKLITAVVAVALAVTSIPYLYAASTVPADRVFVGIIYNVPDNGQYLAWMRASQSGFFISNTLTSEPNSPAFFNLVFWLLGRAAGEDGLALVQVFSVFRYVAGALSIVSVYYFCSLALDDLWQRRTAFLLIVFTAGLGGFLLALSKLRLPIEFPAQHIAEGNSLYSMMAFPLLTFGMALFTLVLGWSLQAYRQGKLKYAVGAGLVGLVLGLSHGYDLILVYGVLFVFTLVMLARDGWSWRWMVNLTIVVTLSVPPALYFVYLTRTDAVWREVLAQFANAEVFSPDPLNLLLLMGIPLLLALVTFDGILPLRARRESELLVKTWFGVNFFLIYLPVEYQIHFINGWQIPICILATIGLYKYIVPQITNVPLLARRLSGLDPARLRALLAVILLLVVLPTNLYFVGWRVLDMSRHQAPYFLPRDELAAFEWLRLNTTPDDVVLSSLDTGQFVPGFAGNRTFLAHWSNTLDFFKKRAVVKRFFGASTPDAERLAVLNQGGVRYLVYGDAERQLGEWDPSRASWLRRVWSSPAIQIFEVQAVSD